jgi:hypothetical protein
MALKVQQDQQVHRVQQEMMDWMEPKVRQVHKVQRDQQAHRDHQVQSGAQQLILW